MSAPVTVTYFVEIISSWCHWGEPAWRQLKAEFAGRVDFDWKIALLDASGLPETRAQMEWYYRRSGLLTRSPYMLNSGWFETKDTDYTAPNAVAWAARSFGITGDEARLALAEAAVRHGQSVAQYDVSAQIVAQTCGLDADALARAARSPETLQALQEQTTEFHRRGATQRPSFVLQSEIGDYVLISGLISLDLLRTAIQAQLDDVDGYRSYAAHFGTSPNT